ncbi:MAG: DNA repair protein RadC [Taibaiella sp.]|nr:DNA repair protein RadC [Taibaiella sp.]
MPQNKPIKDWAEDDQPRAKMLTKGAASLSNAELIGILLRTGSVNRSAIDLGREIMTIAQDNLHKLSKFNIKQLQQVKGVGLAKAVALTAAMELGRRRQAEDILVRKKFGSSKEAAQFQVPLMQDFETEKFCVLYLNHANKLISYEFISHGSLSATIVDIKVILRNALHHLSSKLILGHNHPSGNPKASQSDIQLTNKIKQAAKLMDIELLDHIIVAENKYTSLKDESLIQ